MNIFAQLAQRIIIEQESIIGPVALEQARKVSGLKVDWDKQQITIDGDEKNVIEQLVEKYQDLFGRASVEACRDAVKSVIGQLPKDQVPPLLLR